MESLTQRCSKNWQVISSFIGHILTLNVTHISICFVGGLCSFLPLSVGIDSNFENTIMRQSLSSGYYFRDSSMASLTLAIPLLIDILLDLTTTFSSFSTFSKKKGLGRSDNRGPCCLNNIEKFMLLVGIISVPLTAFLPYDQTDLGIIFYCCKKYQMVIVSGVVMISLCRNNVKFWTVNNTVIFLIVLSSATSLSTFLRDRSLRDPSRNNSKLEVACACFQWAPIVCLVIYNLRWLSVVAFNYNDRVNYTPGDNNRQSDVDLYFTTVWVLTTTLGMVFLIVLSGTYTTDDKFDVIALLVNNLIFLSFELSITVFLMRIVKSDVVQGLVSS